MYQLFGEGGVASRSSGGVWKSTRHIGRILGLFGGINNNKTIQAIHVLGSDGCLCQPVTTLRPF